MSVQTSADRQVKPFILSGRPLVREAETIAQDAARTAALAPYTLMAKVSATGKWTPWGDVTATDGTAIPQGIYMGDPIAAADLAAADVVNCPIIVGGAGVTFDNGQLVLEELVSPPATIDDVITVGTNDQRTGRERLYANGLFAEDTQETDAYENA
jgi:hypothetical protein